MTLTNHPTRGFLQGDQGLGSFPHTKNLSHQPEVWDVGVLCGSLRNRIGSGKFARVHIHGIYSRRGADPKRGYGPFALRGETSGLDNCAALRSPAKSE